MTPVQLIKLKILQLDAIWQGATLPADMTGEDVEARYDELVDSDSHWDAKSETRAGEFETNIPCESSRHYESKSVAAKVGEQWVGWTYWYGGGKHGEPDGIEWMEDAYLLDCVETIQKVVVREFSKPATA